MNTQVFDVIVIGAGLAGIRSTKELLKNNLNVALITSKEFCSGASFYPGTWGLGMIGPKDENDKNDLLDNITKVGCGFSNPKLSSILVDNVNDEIDLLLKEGIDLKISVDKDGVIPCFDSNKRRWFGFNFKSAKDVFSSMLENKNLTVFNKSKVIDIYNMGIASKGILIENPDKSLSLLKSKSIIIASGGYTSLFEHNFSLELDSPIVHYLAHKIGCKLINLEFVQFIPAYLKPMYKTIVNERIFKYIDIKDSNGNSILKDIPNIDKLMDERSTYGPFTTRLKSSVIDKVLFKYYQSNNESAYFEYPKDIENINDTLIYNYFKWLNNSNKNTSQKIYTTPFAHACNGGIKINEEASTNIDGIFACGEVTGGVHGADRIGGLSTCNALVFGAIAGKSAYQHCNKNSFKDFDINIDFNNSSNPNDYIEYKNIIRKIRSLLYTNASILRSKDSINYAKSEINKLNDFSKSLDLSYADKSVIESYLNFSIIFLDSLLAQNKSVGCHCRID